MALPRPFEFLRQSGRHLLGEWRQLSWQGPRAVLAAQTVGSVLLAVVLADLLGLTDRWWVAISAYVVMRADWRTSLSRAVQRMAGTLGGALAGALLAPWIGHPWIVYAAVLGALTGFGLYRTLGSSRSYGWLLATITVLLVLADTFDAEPALEVAALRVADVAVGTLACVLVAGAVQLGRRRWHWPTLAATGGAARHAIDAHSSHARRERAWQALPSTLAVLLLAAVDAHTPLPAFPEMLVTVTVLPIIPLPVLLARDQSQAAVASRMGNRVLGCLLAAACALLALPWAGDSPWLFMLALSVGIWLASHIQSGHTDISYVGLQFGIAFIMVFVQDQAWTTDIAPALQRLAGILGGVLTLGVIRLGMTWLRALRHRAHP